ncbi:unnamed protein product [Absidia cylindrospora]
MSPLAADLLGDPNDDITFDIGDDFEAEVADASETTDHEIKYPNGNTVRFRPGSAKHAFEFYVSRKNYASIAANVNKPTSTDLPSTLTALRKHIRDEGTELLLQYRDIHFLTRPHLAKDMILSPAMATRYNDAVVDDLHTGEWWAKMQSKLTSDEDTVLVPLMLLWSLATGKVKLGRCISPLAIFKKKLRFLKDYGACRVLVYLPVITVRSDYTSKPWLSLCKTAIFQHCMKLILSPFANATPAGQKPSPIPFMGPYGNWYNCLPLLATYSADYPEQCLLTATKTWRNRYGCPSCLIKAADYKKGLDVECVGCSKECMEVFAQSQEFGCFVGHQFRHI